MTHKHLGWTLIAAAAALEYSDVTVHAGTTATGTLASLEGQLANLNEVLSPTLHLSYIVGAIGIYLLVKGA